MSATLARRAMPGDAEQLTRLHVEIAGDQVVDDAWHSTLHADLEQRLSLPDKDLVAFVIESPNGGFASAAVGFIHHGLCQPDNPTGLTAHLASVATIPAYRRRGYATAVVSAFLKEALSLGCANISLYASKEARNLYKALGFEELSNAMILDSPNSFRDPGPLRGSLPTDD